MVGEIETGYHVVVQRDLFHEGDLVAYIPEASLLPEWLVEDLGLTGLLHGPKKNRVKAIRLRGELSQGLIWAPKMTWDAWFRKYYAEIPKLFDETMEHDEMEDIHLSYEGVDITEAIGVKKWFPEIPSHLSGIMRTAPIWMRPTDSENVKKVGASLKDGETVYATEKIHGTQASFGIEIVDNSDSPDFEKGYSVYVSSKGVLGRGAVIEEAAANDYWRCFHAEDLEPKLLRMLKASEGTSLQIIGEAYGSVQDLTYGNPAGPLKFRAFDIRVNGEFVCPYEFFQLCRFGNVPTVPLLYTGPYSVAMVGAFTDGMECVTGLSLHMREGIVIKPMEDRHERWGRCSVKSVSSIYLMRKGNTTEFE